jgi:DNA-binding transcriptional MocR family regulator
MRNHPRNAEEIYRWLEERVRAGDLKPGERLDPVRTLAERLNVQKNTVQAAYAKLQRAGITVSLGRNGTIVRTAAAFVTPMQRALPEGVVDLGHGNPDPEFLPTFEDLARVSDGTDAPRPVLYGDAPAHLPLVAWFAERFAQDQLPSAAPLMMGGALDALDGVMRCFLNRGDVVAVEEPAYPALLQLLALHGLTPVPLALDAQGITRASFAAALDKNVSAIFTTSRAQNPTGVSLTPQRGAELAKIARKHRGALPLLVDDDHFNTLAAAPYVPWFSGIKGQRWLTIRSVSKYLGPDLRLSAVAGDEATVDELRRLTGMTRRWQSHHLQRVAHGLLTDRTVLERIARARAAYAERRAALLSELANGRAFPDDRVDGLNIWIPSERCGQLDAWLLGRGWAGKAGEHFALFLPPWGLRITCATLDQADCRLVGQAVETFFNTFQ